VLMCTYVMQSQRIVNITEIASISQSSKVFEE
jgi:hypothetical protein